MPMPPRLVRVLAGNRSRGRCKFCVQTVEWAKTARGNPIPLNPGTPIMRVEVDERTGIKYDVLEPYAPHSATCIAKPKKVPPASARHAWAGGRH
jgi:hypothetical protein